MLVNKYRNLTNIAKLKKVYNQVQQTYEMTRADNFDYISLFDNTEEYRDFIEKELFPKFKFFLCRLIGGECLFFK